MLCRSRDRREKEKAMHGRFEQRIDDASKRFRQVARSGVSSDHRCRIGRIIAQNSRAARLFDVEVKQTARTVVSWTKIDTWRDWTVLNEGCYLLRTNVTTGRPNNCGRSTSS